ncbi:17789_t:CDS:2, partial [Cetraspora pellucida]
MTKPSSLKDVSNIKASIPTESSHIPSLEDMIKGSDENDDYYGITDESLCLLCKLDHDDDNGIGGRYEVGSYYIKCEQHGIEIETIRPRYITYWDNNLEGIRIISCEGIAIIGLRGVTIISYGGSSVITRGGGIISLEGDVGIISLES